MRNLVTLSRLSIYPVWLRFTLALHLEDFGKTDKDRRSLYLTHDGRLFATSLIHHLPQQAAVPVQYYRYLPFL